ncbi:MAG: hypothetical protein ACOX1Q_09030 [Eubacteriales bacterium]|jgi:hypothetical protein
MGRFKETAKTIIIILLLISALWLTVMTWVYEPSILPVKFYEKAGKLLSFIGIDIPGAVTIETRRVHDLREAASPVRCAITLNEGRYGAEYDNTLVTQVVDRTKRLIGEAIGSASEPTEISVNEWRAALGRTGIYYDYFEDIPLSAIALWQNFEPSPHITGSARHLILSVDDDVVGFYFTAGENRKYLYSKTAVNPSDIAEVLTGYSPNGCVFAFENEKLAPKPMDELFLFKRPPIRVASASRLSHENIDFNELLKTFGMSLSSNRYTQSRDNTVVAVDGPRTLTLSEKGDLVYSDTEEGQTEGYVIYVSKSSEAEIIENIRLLSEQTAGLRCGDASLRLSRFEYDKDKNEYTVGFDYFLDGVPVFLSNSSDAATFRIRGGVLVYAHVQLRSFVLEDETFRPLPLETAIVLAGEGADSGLCYAEKDGDSTGRLEIKWFSK